MDLESTPRVILMENLEDRCLSVWRKILQHTVQHCIMRHLHLVHWQISVVEDGIWRPICGIQRELEVRPRSPTLSQIEDKRLWN